MDTALLSHSDHLHHTEIQIGFQRPNYTFTEPTFQQEISGVVFLEKEFRRESERTFQVVIEVSTATPNQNIQAATLSSFDADGNTIDNDYLLVNPDQSSFVSSFLPEAQLLEFQFTLFGDEIAEGPEAFQASLLPLEGDDIPQFTAPTTLFASTFIIIEDNDCKFLIGHNIIDRRAITIV